MNALWRFELLGQLCARRGDLAVTRFRSYKTAALLAVLAYRLGRRHPREQLTEILWPDFAPGAAGNNLSQALFALRQQLEPPGVARGSVIQTTRADISLDPAACATDVAGLEAALDAAEAVVDPAARARALAAAVDLYRGELLPDHYHDWVLAERARVRARFLKASHEVIEDALRRGEARTAHDLARRALAADTLNEEAHRDLMAIEAAIGNRVAVARQYRELESLLAREIGVAPQATTRELARRSVAETRSAPRPTGVVTLVLVTPVDAAARERLERLVARHRGYTAPPQEEPAGAGAVLEVAFERPSDALPCALAIGKALVGAAVALDTGEVADPGEATVSARARALLGAAHPGQAVCSERTAALLRLDLDVGVRLADLGAYRLRAGAPAERIFEVAGAAGETPFPPLRAEAARSPSLPLELGRIYGREAELAAIERALGQGGVRLLTITGPGGIGKTRLAHEAARRLVEPLRGAVVLVPLADTADPAHIGRAILDALRIAVRPTALALDQIAEAIGGERSLLVLDNLEHLLPAAGAFVAALLARASGLAVIATSRRRLGLSGERELPLGPLATPVSSGTLDDLAASPAVGCFVDRVQAARPDFAPGPDGAAVAELVRRLEGVPLALILAAARARILSPRDLLVRLFPGGEPTGLDFLADRGGELPERHRSLRTALAGSLALLPPEVRAFFARLTVFRGGFTLDSAEAVCAEPLAADFLAELRDASLLQMRDDGAGACRYALLESVRALAADELAPVDAADIRHRHADHFLATAERLAPELRGAGQVRALARLSIEHENLRAAFDVLAADPAAGERELRLAAALGRFWYVRHHLDEGRRRLASALSRAPARTLARAGALAGAGGLAWLARDMAAAMALAEEEVSIRRELADAAGLGRALRNLSLIAMGVSDRRAARGHGEAAEAAAREAGDEGALSAALAQVGAVLVRDGDYEGARRRFEESLALDRRRGDVRGAAFALLNLAGLLRDRLELAAARALFEESISMLRSLGDERAVARATAELGFVLLRAGDGAAAAASFAAARDALRRLANPEGEALALLGLGSVALEGGERSAPRAHFEEARALGVLAGVREVVGLALGRLADLARLELDLTNARDLYRRSIATLREVWSPRSASMAGALEGLAQLEAADGAPAEAARLLGAASALREALGAPVPPIYRPAHERVTAATRATLGEAAFAAAFGEGREAELEATIARLLST